MQRFRNGPELVAVPLGLLLLWELMGRLGMLPAGLVPAPSQVFDGWTVWAFGKDAGGFNSYSGTWLDALIFSGQRVLQGFLLATIIGVPLGILIGWSSAVRRYVDPTLQSLRPIPITAWLPFSVALFGVHDSGAIFLIALGAFYPILVNATHGAEEISTNLLRAARMLGARDRQILFRVVFPNALPSALTGMRLGMGVAWTAVIVAELVAVKSGLGYVIWDAYYVGRMDIVLADMATIGLLGFLSDQIIVLIMKRTLTWRPGHER
ncbi:MAG TPA: ABC transporter permease [Pseudolabrys sp.]|nr:ABC transporter permease [Pseudolabrys sp.]